jgi:hypothetical protein
MTAEKIEKSKKEFLRIEMRSGCIQFSVKL